MKGWFILFFMISSVLFSEEKLFEIDQIGMFNEKLVSLKDELKKAYVSANEQALTGVDEQELLLWHKKIKALKEDILSLEENWKKSRVNDLMKEDEGFAIWDQGESTVSNLVMEYGSSDYLYVIPQELSTIKIQLYSSIPLPYESWDEMVKLILSQNGIGVKKINPFCKQLYVFKQNPGCVEAIVQSKNELDLLPDHMRIFYVFSPVPEKIKSSRLFFERFSDPKQTVVHVVGTKIVIVSTKESIQKLIDLYMTVSEDESGKKMAVIPLKKLGVIEGEKILKEFFSEDTDKSHSNFFNSKGDELKILLLDQEGSLILIGPNVLIQRAQSILEQVESQLKDPQEMTIFWYTCKHTDPDDLAQVLDQVYASLSQSNLESEKKDANQKQSINVNCKTDSCNKKDAPYSPVLPVNPPISEPGVITDTGSGNYGNFIVDSKTGSILMVVRRDELDKIKSLLEKLDVPKKMVQIDVLLVEKRLLDRKKIGVNLLKIGTASGNRETAISFDTNKHGKNKGILDFILNRPKGSFPAFDLTYQFLLAQDDLQINASPSVLAINHTPATISIVEEISINNGAVPIDTTGGGLAVEQSFTRAQYGITIVMTPTIFLSPEEKGFINLQTNITFDTTHPTDNDRPPVTRRHIENEVRIADGETVILGGLRRKSLEESRERIPFLGEIPCIGKLFGLTSVTEGSTEMIIFLTPHIIYDPIEDLRKLRVQQVEKRPGDIPEFLERLKVAKQNEKVRIMEKSFSLIWDKL